MRVRAKIQVLLILPLVWWACIKLQNCVVFIDTVSLKKGVVRVLSSSVWWQIATRVVGLSDIPRLVAHLDIILLCVQILSCVNLDEFSRLLINWKSLLICGAPHKVIYIGLFGILLYNHSILLGCCATGMMHGLAPWKRFLWVFLDQNPVIHTVLIGKAFTCLQDQ